MNTKTKPTLSKSLPIEEITAYLKRRFPHQPELHSIDVTTEDNLRDIYYFESELRHDLNPIEAIFFEFASMVEQTSTTVLGLQGLCGSGKTRGVLGYYAQNYKVKSCRKAIIAFHEVETVIEKVIEFTDMVREKAERLKDKSEVAHIGRYIDYVFEVPEDLEAKLQAKLEFAEGEDRELIKKKLNFIAHTKATTRLSRRIPGLFKARVIFTTHQSLLNLACVGVTAHRNVIIDEVPKYYVWLIQNIESREQELAKLELDKAGLAGPNDVTQLHAKLYTRGLLLRREFSTTDKDGLVNHKSEYAVDFKGFHANSITIMGAHLKGTAFEELMNAAGEDWRIRIQKGESERKSKARELMDVKLVAELNCSSSAHATNAELKAFRPEFIKMAQKAGKKALVAAHGNHGKDFKGCVVAKLDEKGGNDLSGKTEVYADSLSYFTPAHRQNLIARWGDPEKVDTYEANVISQALLQTIWRSAVRKGRKITVYCYDKRVVAAIERFLA